MDRLLNAAGIPTAKEWRRSMEGVQQLLEELQKNNRAKGHFLGLLHILIGRRVSRSDGTLISTGLTWRDLSILLRLVRWEPELVRDLGIDPESLPPRDRQRFWYSAIAQAGVASEDAVRDGNKLAAVLSRSGYVIGPAPGSS